jgi:hypothetical protein
VVTWERRFIWMRLLVDGQSFHDFIHDEHARKYARSSSIC